MSHAQAVKEATIKATGWKRKGAFPSQDRTTAPVEHVPVPGAYRVGERGMPQGTGGAGTTERKQAKNGLKTMRG